MVLLAVRMVGNVTETRIVICSLKFKTCMTIKYYKNLIGESSHNSGLLWQTINDIIKNKNKSFIASTKLVNTSGQNTFNQSAKHQ